MAWTDPKTWASEPLISTDLNTHIRDNQNSLHSRVTNTALFTATAEYTTTSTSFADVDADDFALTLTIESDTVLIGLGANAYNGTSGSTLFFGIAVDDVDQFTNGITGSNAQSSNDPGNSSFSTLLTGLTPGERTFKLRWKVGNNTGKLQADSTFWVREV